jgi:Ca2+-binding RTX toxin-like protein
MGLDGDDGFMNVLGSRSADSWGVETREPGTFVNLNHGAETEPDFDVAITDMEFGYMFSGDGDDRIEILTQRNDDAAGGGGFLDLFLGFSGVEVDVGPGDDAINASTGADSLHGGPGDDRIRSGGGPDNVIPGAGKDRVRAGGGSDRVRSRDGSRDFVGCGAGADNVRGDSRDRFLSCERRRRGARSIIEIIIPGLREQLRNR